MIAPAGSPVVTPASYMRDIFTPRRGKARVYYTLWRDTGLPSQMPPSPEKSLLDTVNIGLPFGTVQF